MVFGSSEIAVMKSITERLGAVEFNRDVDTALTKGTIADGSMDCKRTGDEVSSFNKLLTSGAGSEGNASLEDDKQFISASIPDGGTIGTGTVEESAAISAGNRPLNAEPQKNGSYLDLGMMSVELLLPQSKP